MNLHKRVLFAAATALVVAASPASAGAPGAISATSWAMTNYCGGTVFVSCATVTASVSGSVLTLTVTKTGGSYAASRFGAIGFIGATTGTLYGFGPCDATHSCYTGSG